MAAEWEVGPTKDVIQAFMETLVDPKLPLTVWVNNPPFEDTHKSVARQMHAVVLLYNYYYRKQRVELEFLDFVSFCKLALSLRSSLMSFLDTSVESRSNAAENQLSATEIAVKNACDIAMLLDASKDVPEIEACRICKVAVLLIDSRKDNCLLQFGAVTEGVWSLIEKEIDESSTDQELLVDEQVPNKKRKTDTQQASTGDSKYLQLAYDAVKDVAGIDSSDLVVLETHVVYSLSKKNSAAQFYMMHCSQSFNINQRVPLKFLVESLQGPFVEKFGDSWTTTTLVEYHHMLPYGELISSWLSRKGLCSPISSGCTARNTKNCDEKVSEHIDNNSSLTKISLSEKVANEISEDDAQKKRKHSSVGGIASSVNVFKQKHGHVIDESENKYDCRNSAKRGSSSITLQSLDNNSDKREKGLLSDPSRGLSKVAADNATQKMNNTSGFAETFPTSEDIRKKPNSSIKVYHQRRKMNFSKQQDGHGPENGLDLKVTAGNGDATILSNQSEISAMESSLDQLQAIFKIEEEKVQASKDLEDALVLLDRRRQELYSRTCTMEDELASYEHIMEQIRDSRNIGLARKCIKLIVSGSDHLLPRNVTQIQDEAQQPDEDHNNPESENRNRFSVTFFPEKSSCLDLDNICVKNMWRLPRYVVQRSSNGKFMSTVVVQSKDFNLKSKGASESSPHEARESVAGRMMTKIRNRVKS